MDNYSITITDVPKVKSCLYLIQDGFNSLLKQPWDLEGKVNSLKILKNFKQFTRFH